MAAQLANIERIRRVLGEEKLILAAPARCRFLLRPEGASAALRSPGWARHRYPGTAVG